MSWLIGDQLATVLTSEESTFDDLRYLLLNFYLDILVPALRFLG
jgi:hypothetical protein